MSATPRFGRLLTAMVTPFTADGHLDLPRAGELADRLIATGTQGLIVCGTTGESPTVFYDQKLELFRTVIDAVGGRVPIVANVGDNCTDDSVEFARKVTALGGVDAIMAVVPYYNKPPQEGMYRHFCSIASAVDVPVIMYNIPARCVVNMEPETILRVARDCGNVVAVKQSNPDLAQVARIVGDAPDGFEVLSGDDEMTLPIMAMGGTGIISVASHVVGPQMAEMIAAQVAGEHTRALKLHLSLLPLFKALFMTANPIMVKDALRLAGFPVGTVRLPLVPPTPEQSAELARVMRGVGLLA
ncbi:MAG: 4-hydroxy-tetrahydrodipicolinate synthase [Actinobacteria bacterium]|nr:MAG: 4-hydroxy-tetrahydrodipicolinate synthase [Actinomycetota bacterium]